MQKKLKILLVEDEEAIRSGLTDVLTYHGYTVDAAPDGRLALEMYAQTSYDLVILDIMLPHVDGLQVCNHIRSKSRSQPLIMLTAKTGEEDIINGLTLGADDYIAKPFSVRELVLRVEAVLRRSAKLKYDKQPIQAAGIEIDTQNLIGLRGAEQIEFSRREVDILSYLMQHRERPVSRSELLEQVWGYERAQTIETRTVDIHIAKLRRKIEADPKNPACLVTVRGEGYKLLEPGA